MEYLGTEMKWAVTTEGVFDMTSMEWDMVFFVGSTTATMRKRNVDGGYTFSCDAENMGFKPLSDGSWAFLVDTAYFGPGRLCAILYAYIPDSDFDPTSDFSDLDSVRTEVRRYSLETIVKP